MFGGSDGLRGGCFAAFGTPEDGPGDEVGGEGGEAVFDVGGNEEGVAFVEGVGLAVDGKSAGAFDDDVELVRGVGGLVVEAAWSEDDERHGSVLEGGFVPDALRPGGGGGEWEMGEGGFEVDVHGVTFQC